MSLAPYLATLVLVSAPAEPPRPNDDPKKAESDTAEDAPPPFTDAQLEYLENLKYQLLDEAAASASTEAPAEGPAKLTFQAEAFMKWLYRNNTTQGCVTYGNPHPSGDNYSGDNGACPEFALTVTGRPTPQIEGGFRLQSRYGQQFADYFENGDLRDRIDASSESLGQNHSAPIQLRGIYVRLSKPLPGIDWFLAGSSDLAYFDPWTVGKARFIERFNAKGIFVGTSIPDVLRVTLARIALSKLFGTANYNGLEEPLLTNPFWARDAIYATSITTDRGLSERFRLTLNAGLIVDEEANRLDPDAPGSTNTVDERDDVTATAARFTGANASLLFELLGIQNFRLSATMALSYNDPDDAYVTNLAAGGLGFTNVVYDQVSDLAGTLRTEIGGIAKNAVLKAEYFYIGSHYNAVVGARREADVLLTDGFLGGGQLPTLNLANELMDFSDPFYESIVGWHGGTLLLETRSDRFDFDAEATVITYNTNAQDRDMDVYPGFGGFTGYTDTQLFSYANTNDRGRDPRAVYRPNQKRNSAIAMTRGRYKPSFWRGADFSLKLKGIVDRDDRDLDVSEDDYRALLLVADATLNVPVVDALRGSIGFAFDHWREDARSGSYAGAAPRFFDYRTTRLRPYVQLRYSLGPVSASYHLETLKKQIQSDDPELERSTGLIWRSIGTLSAQF